jgi:hypothetical protein
MLVLVDAISMFRMRYLVEVEDGKPCEWACDTVVCQEAKEFGQQHLDEIISSYRVVTEEEAIKIFKQDNSYASEWPEETVKKNAFTMLSDLKEKEKVE